MSWLIAAAGVREEYAGWKSEVYLCIQGFKCPKQMTRLLIITIYVHLGPILDHVGLGNAGLLDAGDVRDHVKDLHDNRASKPLADRAAAALEELLRGGSDTTSLFD